MNDTAHNIIQLNQQTVYGSEVALCIWPIGWSSGLVFRYCYCNNCLYCLEGDFYAEFADCVTCIKNGRSAKTKIIMLGLSDPWKWRQWMLSNIHNHSPKFRASELWRSAYITNIICGNGNYRLRKLPQMAAHIYCCYQSKIVGTLYKVQTLCHLRKNFITTCLKPWNMSTVVTVRWPIKVVGKCSVMI